MYCKKSTNNTVFLKKFIHSQLVQKIIKSQILSFMRTSPRDIKNKTSSVKLGEVKTISCTLVKFLWTQVNKIL